MANFDASSYFAKKNASKADNVAAASSDKKQRLAQNQNGLLGKDVAPRGAIASSVGIGAGQVGELVGTGYGLMFGDMDNALRTGSQAWTEDFQERKPQQLQDRESRVDDTINNFVEKHKGGVTPEFVDEALGTLKAYSKDPTLVGHLAIEEAPSILAQGGTSALMKKAGMDRAISMVSGQAAGGAEHGADTAGGVYDRLMDGSIPQSEWEANPAYQRNMQAGMTDQKAKHELALDQARAAFWKSGITGVLTEFVPGGRALQKSMLGEKFGKSVFSGAAEAAGGQVLQETIQEGTGQYIANREVKEVKRDQNLQEGVGRGAVTGGLAGGTLGAPFGAIAGRQKGKQADRKAKSEEAAEFMAAAETGYETGDVGVLKDRNNPNYNPAIAIAVHQARQQDKPLTPEEKTQERNNAQHIREDAQVAVNQAQEEADSATGWLGKKKANLALKTAQETLKSVDESLAEWDNASTKKQEVKDAGVAAANALVTSVEEDIPAEVVSEEVDKILASLDEDEDLC